MSSAPSMCADASSLGAQHADFEASLRRLAPASAALLAERSLLRRIDTKFLVPAAALAELVDDLAGSYRVVETMGRRRANYATLYFDDAGLSIFRAHQQGRALSFKVRIRSYPERGLTYLELKRELEGGMRDKSRWKLPYGASAIGAGQMAALRSIEDRLPSALEPRVWTYFQRATLLSESSAERVTMDTYLSFRDAARCHGLDQLAVVEVKQSTSCGRTPIMRALARAGYLPRPISKYCMATHLLRG